MDHGSIDSRQIEALLAHFRSSADYERSSSYGIPSINYFWYRKRREVLRLLRKHVADLLPADATLASPALLLDLGCDTGIDLYLIHDLLKSSGPWPFIGVDGNPGAVAQARLKQRHYGAEVEFLQADITERLPFADDRAGSRIVRKWWSTCHLQSNSSARFVGYFGPAAT